ncbi:MAG: hypothetical protein Q9184_007985, partial [Pyrenodesmia sp. 2 TL-2023]
MASSMPAALKSADVARFAQRAGQVEKAKPAIAYWCNYWIVNQLISRGLHNVDEECTRYTTELMDRLERTADTLLAAAVFLELRQIWEPLDPETSSKVKYAKYHALRIAKAIKAGEDPNATNPTAESNPAPGSPLNSNGVDTRLFDDRTQPIAALQPMVEDVSDERDSYQRHSVPDSSADQSRYSPRPQFASSQLNDAAPTPPEIAPTIDRAANYYRHPSVPNVSPLQSPDRGRDGSIGGGYFPRAPDAQERGAMTGQPPSDMGFSSPPGLPDTSYLPRPNGSSPSGPPDHSAKPIRPFPPSRMDQDLFPSSPDPATPFGPQPSSVAPEQHP